jgi:hypothetical protein
MRKLFTTFKTLPGKAWALTGIPWATRMASTRLAERGWYLAGAALRHPFLFVALLLVLWGAHYRVLTATSKLEVMVGALGLVYVLFFYLAQLRETRAQLRAGNPVA